MSLVRDKQHGFTLIEMLLVVIILGIATLYSMSFIREKQRQNDIKNTAQQMKNIIQLALEYHSRYDEWPADANELNTNLGVENSDFCTVWPGSGNSACPNNTIITVAPVKDVVENPDPEQLVYDGGRSNKTKTDYEERLYANFTVSLTLPSQLRNPDAIIRSIANYLPSAVVSGNSVMLYTSARISMPQPINTYGYITHAGIAKTNGSALPVAEKCYQYKDASNNLISMEKHVFLAMTYGVTDYKRWYSGLLKRNENTRRYFTFLKANTPNCGAQGDCSVSFDDANSSDSGKLNWELYAKDSKRVNTSPQTGFYYLSLCVPYKMWQTAANVQALQYVFQPTQVAGYNLVQSNGQCNGAWTSNNAGVSSNNCNLGLGKNLYDALGL